MVREEAVAPEMNRRIIDLVKIEFLTLDQHLPGGEVAQHASRPRDAAARIRVLVLDEGRVASILNCYRWHPVGDILKALPLPRDEHVLSSNGRCLTNRTRIGSLSDHSVIVLDLIARKTSSGTPRGLPALKRRSKAHIAKR